MGYDGSSAPRRPHVRGDAEWDVSTGDYGEFHFGVKSQERAGTQAATCGRKWPSGRVARRELGEPRSPSTL